MTRAVLEGVSFGLKDIFALIQAAGILASGLMETFLPAGVSELAQNNWLTRIIGGIVGARPVPMND